MMEGNDQSPKAAEESVKPDAQDLKDFVSSDFMKGIIDEMGLDINDA